MYLVVTKYILVAIIGENLCFLALLVAFRTSVLQISKTTYLFQDSSKLGYKFSFSSPTPRLASTDELILTTRSSVPLISAAKKMHPYNHKKVCKSYKNHTRTKHGARVTIICRSRANLQYRHHDHWECSAAINMADDLVNIWTLLFL